MAGIYKHVVPLLVKGEHSVCVCVRVCVCVCVCVRGLLLTNLLINHTNTWLYHHRTWDLSQLPTKYTSIHDMNLVN